MSEVRKTTLDEAAEALGIDLLPWQREVGQRILNGEAYLLPAGRRAGRKTLRDVIQHVWYVERNGWPAAVDVCDCRGHEMKEMA